MSRIKKVSFAFLLMFTMSNIGIMSAPLLEASELSKESASTIVSEQEIKEYDKYISANSNGYYLIESAYSDLSYDELTLLEEQIAITNNSFDVNDFEFTDGKFENVISDDELGLQGKERAAGVTKVDFYWWGLKAYLSRNVVRAAGVAGTGAAAYIASTLSVSLAVGAALAAGIALLGYALSSVPHGVGIRYTYALGVTAVWWQ